MRLLILARTAIIYFFYVGTCFGTTSSTRREKNIKSSFNGTNEEARGNGVVDYLGQSAVRMAKRKFGTAEAIEDFLSKLTKRPRYNSDIRCMMEKDNFWQSTEKEMDVWLQGKINPKTVFSYLKLESVVQQELDLVALKYDPKLILWFRYILRFRRMDSTGSNYAAFNNKSLVEFLAEQFRLQNNLKLSLSLHDETLFNPYVPVVSLFDSYRDEQGMEDFAADMLAYMVTDSITTELLLNTWLRKQEPPETIFNDLHLEYDEGLSHTSDVTVFTVWLQYVKKCLNSGVVDFDIVRFVNLKLLLMYTPRAKVMFESNALESVLGDVEYKTSNLAAHVRDIWRRFPQDLFFFRRLYGQKITQNNIHKFVGVIASIGFYVESKPFNGDLMFDLLNKKHSFDEVVILFQGLEQSVERFRLPTLSAQRVVKSYAHTMVQYLSDPSSMLQLSHLDTHPEVKLDQLISDNVDASIIKEWFPIFVAHYRRVEKKNIREAIVDVILLLHKKLPYTGDSRVSWLTIVGDLQEEDARIQSALKYLQHRIESRLVIRIIEVVCVGCMCRMPVSNLTIELRLEPSSVATLLVCVPLLFVTSIHSL